MSLATDILHQLRSRGFTVEYALVGRDGLMLQARRDGLPVHRVSIDGRGSYELDTAALHLAWRIGQTLGAPSEA